MRRNYVKKIAAIAVAAMGMTILAGCGSTQSSTAATTAANTAATEESAAEETTAAAKITEEETSVAASTDEAAAEDEPVMEGDAEEEFMPGCFLDEKTGKDVYDSYDEIVDALDDGEAYAYVKLTGQDDDVLLVTQYTYDNLDGNMAAIDAGVYLPMENGKIVCGSYVTSGGTAYPVSVKDGVLYTGGNHFVESYVVAEETGGLMIKDTVTCSYDSDGNASYSGFLRADNTFDEAGETEVTDENGEQALDDLFDNFLSAEVVNFTVIGQ